MAMFSLGVGFSKQSLLFLSHSFWRNLTVATMCRNQGPTFLFLTRALWHLTGLFMALQPRIIACGAQKAALAMGARFFVGPALMAVSSLAIGMRGKLLSIAIVQVKKISSKYKQF